MTTSVATSVPIQAAIARYLSSGVYDRHLRRLRRTLLQQQERLLTAIQTHFPDGDCDALVLQARALEHGISIAPGPMFSARGEYPHAIRLNYGHPWTADTERAVATLGTLIREQRTRRSRRDS